MMNDNNSISKPKASVEETKSNNINRMQPLQFKQSDFAT